MKFDQIDKPDAFSVLIVDDATANLKLLSEILADDGYVVRPANNGELALRSVKAKLPAIILLDVRMPDMDGYEVCRRLKADINTNHIPVIFISALDDEHSKMKGFEVGGVDFITKPFHKEEVLVRVKTHINLRNIQLELELQKNRLVEEIEERKSAQEKLNESEEQFRTTLYGIGDGVITTDDLGRIKLMNQVAEQLTGWTQSEARGMILEEVFCIINEHTRGKVEIPVRKVIRDGIVVGLANHTLLIAKDGTERPIADSGAPIRNEKGEITGVVLVFRDQTEERQAERALSKSEEKFRNIVESSPSGMYFYHLNDDGSLIFSGANPSADRILGLDHKTLIGKTLLEAFPGLANTNISETYTRIAKGELDNQSFEIEYHDTKNVYYNVTVFNSGLGSITVEFIDISRQKKNEQEIIESEKRFRNLFEHSSVGKSMTGIDGTLHVNPAFCDMVGYTEAELANKHWTEISHPEDEQMTKDKIACLLSGKTKIARFEKRYIHKNGSIVWSDVSTYLECDENQQPLYFITSIYNITPKKIAEQEKFKLLNIIENSFNEIFLFDAQTLKFEYVNSRAINNLGYTLDEIKMLTPVDIIPEYNEQSFSQAIEPLFSGKENILIFETTHRRKDGTDYPIEVHLQLTRQEEKTLFFAVVNDISEQRRSQNELIQSEERFRKAITEAPFPIMIHADDEQVVAISRGWTEMSGYEKSDIPTTYEWTKLAYGKEQSTVKSYIDSLYKIDHWVDEGEYSINTKSGEQRIWDFSSSLLGHMSDGHRLVISMAKDVTERKKAESELLEANQKMDAFFNQSLDGFFFMMLDEPIEWNDKADKDSLLDYAFTHQRITKINQAMLDQYGAQLSDFQNSTPTDFFAHDIEQGKTEWRKLFDFGKLHSETDERKLSGEQVVIEGDYICLYDVKGHIIGHFGIQRDITQAKKAITDLEESEKKFRTVIESSNDGISILDLQGNILFANSRKTEMIGATSCQELIGRNAYSLLTPDYQLKFSKLNTEFLSKGYLRNIEAEVVRMDDSTFWGEFNFTLVTDKNKKPAYIMDSMRDITERKENAEIINQERKLLRTLIDNLPVTVYVKDINACKIVTNKTDIEVAGKKTEAEVIGKTDLEVFDNEIGQRGYYDDIKVLQTGEAIINREEMFIDETGQQRWLITSKIPLVDKHEKISGLVGVGLDITEKKKSELQIRKLSESIEQSPSTIIITDINGTIEYVNPKFLEITGYTKEDAVGQNPRILKSGETPDEVYKILWKTITAGDVWRGEFLNRKKNGDLYWEWATLTSIKNELGVITNYIAIKEDISLRKQMEADLIMAKEKAEESDRLKSTFLANMSHEIRTPLNSIIGFSELLTDSVYEADQKSEFIQHIINNGNNLLKIINDIMDISKIESGVLKIYKSKINVKRIILKICSQFTIQMEEKSLEFIVDLPVSDYEVVIFADEDRLMQVFNNLIGNALKFTSKGSIQVGYELFGDMVKFYVKDTGIGIPLEYHDKIFDRFRQVEDANSRKYGGNGLGLAITRNLIDLMDGKIWLESSLGKGCTFYFTLPVNHTSYSPCRI